ncbi:MAG: hypothetical protein IT376_07045 [Polyangiaceae bacterium]|nr:hypothetical protein [Polyangiaceae bacterium]
MTKLASLVRSCAAVCALVVVSGIARAQDRDPAAAEALFQQGRAAMDRGDYVAACPKFRESNRLDPAPGTVFNLADCEERVGRLATAWTLFQEVAQKLPPSDPRHGVAKGRADALSPRLPRLTVRLAAPDSSGVVVRRDGVVLRAASLDVPLPVDPGEHELSVEAPGRVRRLVKIDVGEGASETVTLELGAPVDAGGDERPPGSRPGRPDAGSAGAPTLAWVAGGIGIAGLVLGGVAGLATLDAKSSADAECPAKRCSPEGYAAVEDGRTFATLSTVGFVVGAVGVGVGAYLWLGGDEPGAPRAAIVARPRARGASLGLEARF